MRFPTLLLLFASLSQLCAQTTTSVHDVGLTMHNGTTTSPVATVAGQICGPFTCVPFSAPSLSTATSLVRTLRVYGDANSLYVLVMSTSPVATPCLPIPGIDNALILGQPMVVIAFGVTGPLLPSTSAVCQQGVGTYQLVLPPVAPAVHPFVVQALTYSHTTGDPAFTVAVRGIAH